MLRAWHCLVCRPANGGETIAAAPGHVLFESPAVTYTPFAPGGVINGTVAPGWEPVKAAFAGNFAKGACLARLCKRAAIHGTVAEPLRC